MRSRSQVFSRKIPAPSPAYAGIRVCSFELPEASGTSLSLFFFWSFPKKQVRFGNMLCAQAAAAAAQGINIAVIH